MTAVEIGPVRLGSPVVLAPMAGVTTPPFRRLCREAGLAGAATADAASNGASSPRKHETGRQRRGRYAPAGMYVTEMVTSRGLVERDPETMRMVEPDPLEAVRSVQLYGVDPATVAAAVRLLLQEGRADHIDLNFGCPVPKVTRKGGGAALPWKRDLFEAIVTAAVTAADHTGGPGEVPVTVKMRMGIDDEHLTYLDAGRIAQRAGAAAVALHARTASQHYSGQARWQAITRLKETIGSIPVFGNGDIWSAEDAIEMCRVTGCDGVVVGRGCQGRPWLFTDLVAGFGGSLLRVRPGLAEVAGTIRRHATLMIEHFGSEATALRELRKHMSWYLKGYVVGGEARRALGLVASLTELDERLAALDLDQPYPGEGAEGPRGRAGSPKRTHLPEDWLATTTMEASLAGMLSEAELAISGG